MSSHLYLIRKSIKNRLKELVTKPGKLILYLLIIAGFAAAMVTSMNGAYEMNGDTPISYLMLIFFGFIIIFYITSIQKGLASGDAFFGMNDVNFLFVSPIHPRATLLYGLIKLAGMSFLAGIFILFQGTTLASFGLGYDGVLILFGAFILNMMVMTLLSQTIYSAVNGRPGRKRIVRIGAVAIFIPLVVVIISNYLKTGDVMQTLGHTADSVVFAATPILGWVSVGAVALASGDLMAGFGWLSLLALSGVFMFLYLMLSRTDYYEDVLVATETAFEKARAIKEGDLQAMHASTSKVKIRGTGLSGYGAKVFLFKHLRETFRQNRFGFISLNMLIIAGGVIALILFTDKLEGNFLIIILQILMWLQIFMIGTGKGLLETYSHYLYMVPAPPFWKMVWSNMEMVVRTFVESVLCFAIPGILIGTNPLVIFGCMAVYILFTLVLLGVNYVFMRWVKTDLSQGLMVMIYLLAVLIVMLPGVAAALIVGFLSGGLWGSLLGLLILSAWEIVAASVCFALSKSILHNCDMPSMGGK